MTLDALPALPDWIDDYVLVAPTEKQERFFLELFPDLYSKSTVSSDTEKLLADALEVWKLKGSDLKASSGRTPSRKSPPRKLGGLGGRSSKNGRIPVPKRSAASRNVIFLKANPPKLNALIDAMCDKALRNLAQTPKVRLPDAQAVHTDKAIDAPEAGRSEELQADPRPLSQVSAEAVPIPALGNSQETTGVVGTRENEKTSDASIAESSHRDTEGRLPASDDQDSTSELPVNDLNGGIATLGHPSPALIANPSFHSQVDATQMGNISPMDDTAVRETADYVSSFTENNVISSSTCDTCSQHNVRDDDDSTKPSSEQFDEEERSRPCLLHPIAESDPTAVDTYMAETEVYPKELLHPPNESSFAPGSRKSKRTLEREALEAELRAVEELKNALRSRINASEQTSGASAGSGDESGLEAVEAGTLDPTTSETTPTDVFSPASTRSLLSLSDSAMRKLIKANSDANAVRQCRIRMHDTCRAPPAQSPTARLKMRMDMRRLSGAPRKFLGGEAPVLDFGDGETVVLFATDENEDPLNSSRAATAAPSALRWHPTKLVDVVEFDHLQKVSVLLGPVKPRAKKPEASDTEWEDHVSGDEETHLDRQQDQQLLSVPAQVSLRTPSTPPFDPSKPLRSALRKTPFPYKPLASPDLKEVEVTVWPFPHDQVDGDGQQKDDHDEEEEEVDNDGEPLRAAHQALPPAEDLDVDIEGDVSDLAPDGPLASAAVKKKKAAVTKAKKEPVKRTKTPGAAKRKPAAATGRGKGKAKAITQEVSEFNMEDVTEEGSASPIPEKKPIHPPIDPSELCALSLHYPDTYWQHLPGPDHDPHTMINHVNASNPLRLLPAAASVHDHGHITSMVLSPDGLMLATFSTVGSVRIWDTETWSCVQVLQDREREDDEIDEFFCGRFTEDGTRIVVAGKLKDPKKWNEAEEDNHVLPCPLKVFDLVTGKVVARMEGHDEEVLCIKAIQYKGENYYITTSQDGYLIRWKMDETWSTLIERDRLEDGDACMAFTAAFLPHCGNRYLVAACDGGITIFDLESGKKVQHFPNLYSCYCDCAKVVYCLDLPASPTWEDALAGQDAGEAVPEAPFAYLLTRGVEEVQMEEGSEVAVNTTPNAVILHKIIFPTVLGGEFTLSEVKRYQHEEYCSNSWLTKIASNGRYVFAPTYDGGVVIFNLATGDVSGILRDHEGVEVRDVVFGWRSKWVATCSDDGTVKVYGQETS
ncbi:hypothetical protein HKX48_001785 [Thoreauomyces humboldtii]|nr:hypothetical protein HKX48_001785 [Thoreauomyces humboldtii]